MHITHWTWGPAKAGGLLGPGHSHRGTFPKSCWPTQSRQEKVLWKGKTPLLYFTVMDFRLRKMNCPTKESLVRMEAQNSPLQSISFGFSLLPLDLRLWSSLIPQWRSKILIGHLQDELLPNHSTRKAQELHEQQTLPGLHHLNKSSPCCSVFNALCFFHMPSFGWMPAGLTFPGPAHDLVAALGF